MQFLSDLITYLWAVVSSAWGLIALSLEIPELLTKLFPQTDGIKAIKAFVSKRVWVIRVLAVGCLIFASFLVWREPYQKLEPQRAEKARQEWATDAVAHCSDLKVSFTEHRPTVFLELVTQLARLSHRDAQIDLNKILYREYPRPYIGYDSAILLKHVEFALQCLENNGYVKHYECGIISSPMALRELISKCRYRIHR